MAISRFQKTQMARRKTSDIERLLNQYQRDVKSITGDYEKSFGEYQARNTEAMAPFEAEMAKYKNEIYPAYEAQMKVYKEQAAAYQKKIDDYQTMLKDYEANPYERRAVETTRFGRGQVPGAMVDGQNLPWQSLKELGYDPELIYDGYKGRGGPNVIGVKSIKVLRDAPAPFAEKGPERPKTPEAPSAPPGLEEFDTSQFDARRQELEGGLKREIGERKSARLSAVSRRSNRPLMQG